MPAGKFWRQRTTGCFSLPQHSINLLMFDSEGCDYEPADISHPSKIKEQYFGSSNESLKTFLPVNVTV